MQLINKNLLVLQQLILNSYIYKKEKKNIQRPNKYLLLQQQQQQHNKNEKYIKLNTYY